MKISIVYNSGGPDSLKDCMTPAAVKAVQMRHKELNLQNIHKGVKCSPIQ